MKNRWHKIAASFTAALLLTLSPVLPAGMALPSGAGLTVLAAENTHTISDVTYEEITGITLSKKITTDPDNYTYAPDASFYYKVETVTISENDETTLGSESISNVKSGVSGGLYTLDTVTDTMSWLYGYGSAITFTPSGSELKTSSEDGTVTSAWYSASSSLGIDATVFGTTDSDGNVLYGTGIYKYKVTEYQGDYDGILYDQTVYYVYLYVYQDDDDEFFVGNVVVTKTTIASSSTDSQTGSVTITWSDETKVGSTGADTDSDGNSDETNGAEGLEGITFTNNYGDPDNTETSTTVTDLDTTHDLTITKAVAGMAQKSRDYVITVSIDSSDSSSSAELFRVLVNGTETSDPQQGNGNGVQYTIQGGQSIVIQGLTENDVITVAEVTTSLEEEGYTVSYSADGTNASQMTDYSGSGIQVKVSGDGGSVTVTNTLEANVPTGLVLDFAPYLILLLAGAAAAVLFLRTRRSVR